MRNSKKYKTRLKSLKIALKNDWLFTGIKTLLFLGILILGACASMQTPSGGAKDIDPPKVLKEKPKNLSTHFNAKQIDLTFNEFVKLNNAFSEISISPALEIPLEVKAKKTELEIKIEQALEPNTTYTINFGKGIGDVNENNILKNYSYVFSTGAVLDSLSISGSVKSALTNEELKEVTVFILPINRDSLLGKKKPSIYTTTDSAGNFTLNNLRADTYRVYALKEGTTDRIYNSGLDEIGFMADSLNLNQNVEGLVFRVFKEEPPVFKLVDRKIENDGRILLSFNKGLEKPEVRELEASGTLKNAITEFSKNKDSVSIWLPELAFDSLKLGIYEGDVLLDRANIIRNKRETLNRNPQIKDNLANNRLRPSTPLNLIISMPISGVDTSKIELMADSVVVKNWQLVKMDESDRKFSIRYPYQNGEEYALKIAEGAFTAISGGKNQIYNKIFTADGLDDYGNLSLNISLADSTKQYVVELMNEQQKVIRQDVVNQNTLIHYKTYPSGKYRLRFVLDENRNGKWDTGNLQKKLQAEKTWYYEKGITLRPNWDQEEKITIPKDL